MKQVNACWDSAPHFNEGYSLLQWLDDEIVGEGLWKYKRWHCEKKITKWSTEGANPANCDPPDLAAASKQYEPNAAQKSVGVTKSDNITWSSNNAMSMKGMK